MPEVREGCVSEGRDKRLSSHVQPLWPDAVMELHRYGSDQLFKPVYLIHPQLRLATLPLGNNVSWDSPHSPDDLHAQYSIQYPSYYYDEETEAPLYLTFFEDQIEVKKEHAKQFITFLREHQSKICLPVIKRPDIENWGTGIQAIESALQLENTLSKLLQDLMSLASQNSEIDLLNFLKKFPDKQKRNINYLEYQRSYQKELDRLTEKEVTPESLGEPSGNGKEMRSLEIDVM
ncbi:soma ferritin-like [Hyaena hyaena]|uniref:soma ferritin-like n=1 Tax=Hyaena hyaena TaxID=95912 RepID=UPI0019236125|nr:soma ferritin-like [Hyaena hyaena]